MAASGIARRAARCVALVMPLVLAAAMTDCGASAPAPPTSPVAPSAPLGPFVNIAGTWTGTFASANLPTQTITLMAFQASNCVDGAWSSASSDWAGAISGYAGDASYSGVVSFERTAEGGGKCSAAGFIGGPVIGNTLHWTADQLTVVGTCVGDVPRSITIDLQRQ